MTLPMNIFTYLNKKKHKNILNFLDSELDDLDALTTANSKKNISKNIIDYSNALFIVSNEEKNDCIILN
jgi:hypothetical protein